MAATGGSHHHVLRQYSAIPTLLAPTTARAAVVLAPRAAIDQRRPKWSERRARECAASPCSRAASRHRPPKRRKPVVSRYPSSPENAAEGARGNVGRVGGRPRPSYGIVLLESPIFARSPRPPLSLWWTANRRRERVATVGSRSQVCRRPPDACLFRAVPRRAAQAHTRAASLAPPSATTEPHKNGLPIHPWRCHTLFGDT